MKKQHTKNAIFKYGEGWTESAKFFSLIKSIGRNPPPITTFAGGWKLPSLHFFPFFFFVEKVQEPARVDLLASGRALERGFHYHFFGRGKQQWLPCKIASFFSLLFLPFPSPTLMEGFFFSIFDFFFSLLADHLSFVFPHFLECFIRRLQKYFPLSALKQGASLKQKN